jgi:hypothetical protein
VRERYNKGRFQRIVGDSSQHTAIKATNGAYIESHVPASLIDGATLTKGPNSLITNLPRLSCSQRKKNKGTKRQIEQSRVYGCWTAYHENGVPYMTAQYVKDGEMAQQFVEACKPLGNRGKYSEEFIPKQIEGFPDSQWRKL